MSIRLKIMILQMGLISIAMAILMAMISYKTDALITEKDFVLFSERLESLYERVGAEQQILADIGLNEIESYVNQSKSDLLQELKDTYYNDQDEDTFMFIMDEHDAVLLHPKYTPGTSGLFDPSLAADLRGDFSTRIRGEKYWLTYRYFSPWKWKVFYATHSNFKSTAISSFIQTILLVGLILTILTLITNYFSLRTLLSPFTRLVRITGRVAEGDMSQRLELKNNSIFASSEEVRDLVRSFNNMMGRLDFLYAALHKSESHFRSVYQMSPDAITVSTFSEGKYVDVNNSFTNMTGFSGEDVKDKSGLDIHLWVDKAQREELQERLVTDGYVMNFEVLLRKKNGRVFHGQVSGNVVEIGGEEHVILMVRDVSAQLQVKHDLETSLREKESLLKEVHHRVKNNLQVISGLLNLEAAHASNERSRSIYRESQNRIISMALIHEELYQSEDLASVDFGDYLVKLVNSLKATYDREGNKIRVEVEADPVELVVDTAIPCGMIVNELVSNSLKHAFPSGSIGRIWVRFSRYKEDLYRLEVCDNGIGLPSDFAIKEAPTLGLTLVDAISQQLGAAVNIKRDEGTCFELTFAEYHEAGTVLY